MFKINKTIRYLMFIFKMFIFCIILTANDISQASDLNQPKKNDTYDIVFCDLKQLLTLCIDLDQKYDIKINLLNDPYRIILNFDQIIKISKNSLHKINIKTNLINKIRFGYPTKSISRLVIELDQPATFSEFVYETDLINNKTIKLRMEMIKVSRASFEIAKHVLSKNNGNILDLNNNYKDKFDYKAEIINLPTLRPKKITNKINLYKTEIFNLPKLKPNKIYNIKKHNIKNIKKNKDKYIVFIDPGHGGRDPGAIGTLGTYEKKITLQASLELAKYLKKTNKITPILSRTTDIYLPLRKRVKLAKINKADIFISLHADASRNHAANGISVFSLSDKASDKEAKMIADKENAADMIPGIKTNIDDPIVLGTLINMFQRKAMNDSAFLARNIITNLKKTKLAINRGHRFAGFTVLKAHNIPSVLIEIGFISNLKEEKKMLNKVYLKNLSKNLTIAIENYFSKLNN